MDRYCRNHNSLTREEQTLLAGSRVSIIGLGGLGGGVVEMLARIGVGSLFLIDGDRFDTTNLNRQILSTEALVGHPKAEAAKARVMAVNSSVRVTACDGFLDDGNADAIVDDADLVIDCLDSVDTRFLLEDACKRAGVPLISGAIAGTLGQVITIFPEDPGLALVYGERTAKRAAGVENEMGNLSYCALFVAALQASEAVKVLLNRGELLRNKLLIADLMALSFDIVELT
ncbi:MAG: HesA/MoeB/ThiF family protein [Desulfobacterium sp.]|nr:HesA/MoeB/ThiF family protein [Desulfobacterium sp.]